MAPVALSPNQPYFTVMTGSILMLSNDLHLIAPGCEALHVWQQYPHGWVHQLHWSPGCCGGKPAHSHVFDQLWAKKVVPTPLDSHTLPGGSSGRELGAEVNA